MKFFSRDSRITFWAGWVLGGTFLLFINTNPSAAADQKVIKAHPGRAALKLTTQPSNATVIINGRKLKKKTPLQIYDIKPGTHDIIIEKGFYRVKKRIRFKLGEVKELGLKLKLGQGTIRVTTTSKGSLVYLDEKLIGKTPLKKAVSAGSHKLKVIGITRNLGYFHERDIQVIQNDILQIRISKRQFKKRSLQAGDTYAFRVGRFGKLLELKYIPGGSFMMGIGSKRKKGEGPRSNRTAAGNQPVVEGPVHQVTISPFWIGKHEITQDQWFAVTGKHVSEFYNEQHSNTNYAGGDLPAEQVSWVGTRKFLDNLNSRLNTNFRLPTEAEWEYAARAGFNGKYPFGNDVSRLPDYAWYNENSFYNTHLVGTKKPNKWGVYDMLGNVAEWCQDWYSDDFYATGPALDPVNTARPKRHPEKVVRGGSWFDDKIFLYVAGRDKMSAKHKRPPVGFRLVLPIQ